MRILFAGTDSIAVPTLETLAESGLVGAVLTAPDAPGKRGRGLFPSPVKAKAVELGIPVVQPERLGSAARAEVAPLRCDTLLSFCYGRIFGPKFLALFGRSFNIHPSLLPRHRGCAPIQGEILALDREGGISIQAIGEKIDEGDLYLTKSFKLDGTETTASLSGKVAGMAASLADDLLSGLDVFKPRRQEAEGASYTKLIAKDDGLVDFSRPAAGLHALVRAYSEWPRAVCRLDGEPLFLMGVSGSAFDIPPEECPEEPGTICALDKALGLKIATGAGYLYVNRLMAPTKKPCDAVSFANGHPGIVGKVLGNGGQ